MNTLAALLYRSRLWLSAGLVLGAIALAPFAVTTTVDNDLSAWFSRANPLYRDYDRFSAEFGGTQPLIVALRSDIPSPAAPDDGLFTRERLEFLSAVTRELERIPSVQRVQSLANANLLRAQQELKTLNEADDPALTIGPILDLARRSPEVIRRLALDDSLLRGDLVSADGTVTAIVVTFDEARLDQDRARILERIYTTVRATLPEGVSAAFNGSIEISETYNRVTLANQRRFIPPILAITLLAVFVLFRSRARAAIVLVSIAVSVLWTLGLYSAMGFGFNILTAMLTPLIVVLAISDDVHLIQRYDDRRSAGSAETAFKATVSYLTIPLFAASGTTALGLLALATVDIVAVRQFGIGAALGVMVDFASSLVLVPTLLGFVAAPVNAAPHDAILTALIRKAAEFAMRRPLVVLAASLGIAVCAAAGIMRLRVETNHISFFDKAHPLSRSAALIDRDLSGVYSFHVLIEGAPDSLKTPDALSRIDRLATAIAALPHVAKTTSMADYVKRTNQELHGGRSADAVIPTNPQVLAQELLLFTMNDAGRREFERVAASDFSTAQIIVRMPSTGSDLVFDTIEAAQKLSTAMFEATGMTATVTGSGRLFASLDHHLVRSQISSFGTAFVTIFATMFLIFRSVRFGVLALVPNVFPVLVVLGVMGWFDISLNVATVMVASVALGVVDDDTVHFIHRFRGLLATGAGVDEAATGAVASEGRAALTTALVTSSGFAVLMLSEYKPSAWFGGLMALTLGVAFLVEVLVLPATIRLAAGVFDGRARRVEHSLGVGES